MLVPYILPNPRKVRKCDVQESFISHSLVMKCITSKFCHQKFSKLVCLFFQRDPFVDENDDGEYQQTVKRSNVETEPKLHFIGNSSKMVTHAYVLLPGLRLRYENPLKAFEVCFHCFMSMNIPYPKTCSYVWMFIQQIIFNVTTKNDILLPTIQTMINDLTTD